MIFDKSGWTHIQQVSCSLMTKQTKTTDKNGWTHVQDVSYFLVFKLLIKTAKHVSSLWVHSSIYSAQAPSHWQYWINMLQIVSHSLVFKQIKITDENYMHLASELLSSVWADQNY